MHTHAPARAFDFPSRQLIDELVVLGQSLLRTLSGLTGPRTYKTQLSIDLLHQGREALVAGKLSDECVQVQSLREAVVDRLADCADRLFLESSQLLNALARHLEGRKLCSLSLESRPYVEEILHFIPSQQLDEGSSVRLDDDKAVSGKALHGLAHRATTHVVCRCNLHFVQAASSGSLAADDLFPQQLLNPEGEGRPSSVNLPDSHGDDQLPSFMQTVLTWV